MGAANLKSMDVNTLLSLRAQVDAQLAERRNQLQRELKRLEGMKQSGLRPTQDGERRVSPMRGRKIAPKYLDPETGATWAGRGLQPRWLTMALRRGKKLSDFTVDKAPKAEARAQKAR